MCYCASALRSSGYCTLTAATATPKTTVTNLLDEHSVAGLVLNTRDVSERKHIERRLVHEAFHDSLTGLANRALFEDRVRQGLRRAGGAPEGVAVLFLDLDGFKEINDSLAGGAQLCRTDHRSGPSPPRNLTPPVRGLRFGHGHRNIILSRHNPRSSSGGRLTSRHAERSQSTAGVPGIHQATQPRINHDHEIARPESNCILSDSG